MDEYYTNMLRVNALSGLFTSEDLIDMFMEDLEIELGDEFDKDEFLNIIDSTLAELREDQATWPEVTDNDRLEAAFAQLREQGIICMQNAGYTMSDGYDDFRTALDRHPNRSSIRGYCYYHGQDLESAVAGGGLFLAFGPADPKLEETEGQAVGELVSSALTDNGLEVDWEGTFNRRIFLPSFKWQKRLS